MKNKTSARRGSSKNASVSSGGMNVLGASLFGAGVGTVCAVALLLVFSVICMFTSDPDKLLTVFGLVINAIAFFAAGFAATKKKSAAIPVGAVSGAILASLMWIVSLFFGESFRSDLALPVEILIRLSFIIVSILGALLCVNVKKKRK